jgi:hypothetical protein
MEKVSEGRLFLLWKSGQDEPARAQDGEFLSTGALGWVCLDNVYLRSYGARPEGSKQYAELSVGESVRGVVFRLSGERGVYDVYRVK